METTKKNQENAPEQVHVEIGDAGYQAQVRAGKHTFLVDEPESVGGKNTGPTPENLILGALGSCTAITLRMYAERKEWPLEKVEVKLMLDDGPAKSKPLVKDGAFQMKQQITLQVLVHGNLQPEQVERLADIAGRCPVHKILSSSFHIATNLELAGPVFQ